MHGPEDDIWPNLPLLEVGELVPSRLYREFLPRRRPGVSQISSSGPCIHVIVTSNPEVSIASLTNRNGSGLEGLENLYTKIARYAGILKNLRSLPHSSIRVRKLSLQICRRAA